MQIVVKLKDVIIDPAKPLDLTAMPPDKAIALIRKAYGFLAANMNFEIKDDRVHITIDFERSRDEAEARDCFARAMKQAQSGRHNKAVDLLNRVLEIVPEHTEARRNLAMSLMNSGRLNEAKDQLVDVLRLAPDDAWALVILGNIYAKHENNLEVGERFYQKALELSPRDPLALVNYAALKMERKDPDGARPLFEQAVAAQPKTPNPYYGLAILLNDSGKPLEALAVLDRMFDTAEFSDTRLSELHKECREYYLRLNARIADTDYDRLWMIALDYRAEVERLTGIPVDLVEDNSLDDTTAMSVPAWRSASAKHVVRYNSRGKPVVPYIVVRELEAIRMEYEARAAGKGCEFHYVADNSDRTKVIEDHLRMLSRSGVDESEVRPLIPKIVDGLMSRMLLAPLDAILDYRLYARDHDLKPSQFTGMYLRQNQNQNPLIRPEVSRVVPVPVKRAHEIASAAYALFVDSMTHGRTAYAAEFRKIPGMPLAREFADGWQKAAVAFQPGEQYDLLRAFVKAFRLNAWIEIRPQLSGTEKT
ncbi:tetratricopeptide repeat protein [Verrucomicrobiota bacterium]